jgi:hypothetical protein
MKHPSKMASSGAPLPIATIILFVCMGLIIFLTGQLTSRHLGTRIGGSTSSSVTEAKQEKSNTCCLYGFSKLTDGYYNENFVGNGAALATCMGSSIN